MRLKDKVALVTGAGQGIGRGIARMFAQEGARLVLAARSQDKLARLETELVAAGTPVLAQATDVGVREQMEQLFAAAAERFGRLDVLVNNAGVGLGTPVDRVRDEDYDRVINTNLRGMHLGCHLAVPLMRRVGKGSIINISSVHGVEGSPGNTVYAATKGGIIGATRALAAELAPDFIRVNVISPGAIYLGGEQGYGPPAGLAPEAQEEYRRRWGDENRVVHRYYQPLEVVGEPVDIAYLAVYLATDESRFVTGQDITVDGGLTTYLADFPRPDLREKRDRDREEMRRFAAANQLPS
jgi:NAD(P)-dependent dehydrogenase (short-subunit alcohol dehydrogenase family)